MPHSFFPPTRFSSACQQLLGRLFLLLAILVSPAIAQTGQAGTTADAPLVIGNRTIFVFRAPLGEFSAEERAAGARKRIENALATGGEGWTSVKPAAQGHVVALDGKPMFHVLSGDAGDSRRKHPTNWPTGLPAYAESVARSTGKPRPGNQPARYRQGAARRLPAPGCHYRDREGFRLAQGTPGQPHPTPPRSPAAPRSRQTPGQPRPGRDCPPGSR